MQTPVAERFQQNGFALAAALVDGPRLATFQAEADRLVRRFAKEGHQSDDYWSFDQAVTREPVLYRIHNLEKQGSSPISDLFADGPLHTLASVVLGTRVRSTACAMIVKMPRVAARVPWHRDRTSVAPHTVCNLSLFLDESNADNGCLEVVPRSHLLPDDADVAAIHDRGPVLAIPAHAGDVFVHDVRMVHASRANGTAAFRRSIVIEFAPLGLELPSSEG